MFAVIIDDVYIDIPRSRNYIFGISSCLTTLFVHGGIMTKIALACIRQEAKDIYQSCP